MNPKCCTLAARLSGGRWAYAWALWVEPVTAGAQERMLMAELDHRNIGQAAQDPLCLWPTERRYHHWNVKSLYVNETYVQPVSVSFSIQHYWRAAVSGHKMIITLFCAGFFNLPPQCLTTSGAKYQAVEQHYLPRYPEWRWKVRRAHNEIVMSDLIGASCHYCWLCFQGSW